LEANALQLTLLMINRFIRSFFLFIFFLLPVFYGYGQEESYFNTDSDIFIQQVAALLDETSNRAYRDDGKLLMQKFVPRWQAGRFSKAEKDMIKAISEELFQKKYRNYPFFYDFYLALNGLAFSRQPEQSVLNWLKFTKQIVHNQSQRNFSVHLDFTNQLLQNQVISQRGSSSWFLRNAEYRFASDTALIIQVLNSDLVCATRRDSSLIKNTSGIFYTSTNEWQGSGGQIDWWRFDLTEAVQVNLKEYSIDLNQTEYSADSVTFLYKKYFDFKMLGRFEDKVFSSPPGNRTSYPRFSAYFRNYELKDIFEGINYQGGFAMEGATIKGIGNGKTKAKLLFFQEKKLRAILQASDFVLSDDRIISNSVMMTIPMERDSIFHPDANMRYDNKLRQIILYRTETGLADSPFFDSFHMFDLHFEALYWSVDKPEILFRQLEGMRSENSGFLQSMNYFSYTDFDRLRLIDNLHPMFSIENYLKTYNKDNEIMLSWYADFIKKPEEQALTQLLRLAAEGYLVYDPDQRMAIVNERFFHTLSARKGDKDHDVIQISSTTSSFKPNIVMNLDSLILNVSGVEEITLSNAQNVRIIPDQQQIAIRKNRDFTFSGFVGAGLFEFYTIESSFNYDQFKLNFTQVDSLSFFVPLFNQPKRADGRRDYARVRNVISDMSGILYIDQADNKSGKKPSPQYPVFDSKNESYVYFQKPSINENRLLKDDFYYVVDPFEIDSLDDFSTENLRFEGYLNSAGIFPLIEEPLIVLQDYALGFKHQFEELKPIYSEKAFFADSIFLGNHGFWGSGVLEYGPSETQSDSFVFFPDEVRALAHKFSMTEQELPHSFPQAQADTIYFSWLADTNQVILETRYNPLVLFNNVIFKGTAKLNPTELKAMGELSFGQACLKSDYFDFNRQSFTADTSEFKLLTAIRGEPAFVAQKYNAAIDFAMREAFFEYIDTESSLSFPFNNYISTLVEAKWHMDEDKIDLENTVYEKHIDFDSLSYDQLIDLELIGSEFISVHPNQDSLSFFSLQASYNIKSYAIEAYDVGIIKTADAAVFPHEGLVCIHEGARMETLKNAYIIADTSNRRHHFSNATVTVFGRKQFEASGEYQYVDYENNTFPIVFSAIFPDENGITTASGYIEKEQMFRLGPNFWYAGKTLLKANVPLLSFEGVFKSEYACNQQDIPWVRFNSTIDPRDIRIPLDTVLLDEAGQKLYAGLYFDPLDRQYYGSFLNNQRSSKVSPVKSDYGTLRYDRPSNAYKLESLPANGVVSTLDLSINRCLIRGKGTLDLGLDLPLVDFKVVGNYEYLMIPDSISINVLSIFDFMFDDKLLQMMSDSINKAAKSGALLSQSNYLYTLGMLSGTDELNRVQSELSLYGSPRRIPDVYQKSFVFNKLEMSWDKERSAFISQGELRLANVLRNQVNKSISGLVVFEKGRAGDAVTIYMQPSPSEWYYFHYENGIMQAISSSQEFNNRLFELKLEKRILEDPDSDYVYEFVIASKRSVVDFIRHYQLN